MIFKQTVLLPGYYLRGSAKEPHILHILSNAPKAITGNKTSHFSDA
jgi:hypothetical protein